MSSGVTGDLIVVETDISGQQRSYVSMLSTLLVNLMEQSGPVEIMGTSCIVKDKGVTERNIVDSSKLKNSIRKSYYPG